jgi:hypothetical protein
MVDTATVSPSSATADRSVTSGSRYRNDATWEASIRSSAAYQNQYPSPEQAMPRKRMAVILVDDRSRYSCHPLPATKNGIIIAQPANIAEVVARALPRRFSVSRPRIV